MSSIMHHGVNHPQLKGLVAWGGGSIPLWQALYRGFRCIEANRLQSCIVVVKNGKSRISAK